MKLVPLHPKAFRAYQAPGLVVQVFDTNAAGELVPVAFDLADDGTAFTLKAEPHGQVYAAMVPSQAAMVIAAVNSLVQVCHAAAQQWWKNPRTGADLRDNPMFYDQKLMLIVSELAESMEGNRKDLMDDKLPHRKMREVELADALIRICDTAGGFGMDLGGATAEKLAYNAVRADHKVEHRLAAGGKAY